MEFTLTIEDKCYHNELTLNTGIEDHTYHIDRQTLVNDSISTSSLGQLDVTSSLSDTGCNYDLFELYYLDNASAW